MAEPKYTIVDVIKGVGITVVISAAITAGTLVAQVKESAEEIKEAKADVRDLNKRYYDMKEILIRIDQRLKFLVREEVKDSQAGREE